MQESQGSIKVKFHATGEEVSVNMLDLHSWVAGGHIAAEDLIYGEILTNGEWKLAKDLAVFHLADTGILPDSIAARRSGIYNANPRQPVERYAGLKMISKLCFVLAGIIMCFALYAAILLGSQLSSYTSPVNGIVVMGIMLQGGFAALILCAIGAVIPLWIDMESNTRLAKVVNTEDHSSSTGS